MSAMTCQQAVQQFFSYLDRALAGEDLEDVQAHLDVCLACCDRLAFSREVDAFVRARLPETGMPAALEERVRRALGSSVGEGS
jgi:hypothetical protein